MTADEAINLLEKRMEEADDLIGTERFGPDFEKWRRDCRVDLKRIFGEETDHVEDFESIQYSLGFFTNSTPEHEFQKAYDEGLRTAQKVLQSCIEEIERYGLPDGETITGVPILERIFENFDRFARQLTRRYDDRPTIEIQDEYDVQDSLHAALRLHFDDVRPEEWTPSYAGRSSRTDFLLKRQQSAIEVKFAAHTRQAAEIGDELSVDIDHYQSHSDVERLYCFVYDPNGALANPHGLEDDLSRSADTGPLPVDVSVEPK